MSMRARDDGTTSRFTRAKQEALDLLAGAQKGDAIAVVLAGDPVRVALAPSTDLAVVERMLEGLQPSDRGTDLEGAISLAARAFGVGVIVATQHSMAPSQIRPYRENGRRFAACKQNRDY